MVVIQISNKVAGAMVFGGLLVQLFTGPVFAEPGLVSHLGQVAPLRQDSVRMPSAADLPKEAPQTALAPAPVNVPGAMDPASPMAVPPVGGYDPAGRRDPFSPVLSQLAPGQVDPTLPPLQRVNLTDMNLIAIIWGAGHVAIGVLVRRRAVGEFDQARQLDDGAAPSSPPQELGEAGRLQPGRRIGPPAVVHDHPDTGPLELRGQGGELVAGHLDVGAPEGARGPHATHHELADVRRDLRDRLEDVLQAKHVHAMLPETKRISRT